MKKYRRFNLIGKSFRGVAIGGVWVGMGLFLLLSKHFSDVLITTYGVLCIIYGLWRIYVSRLNNHMD